MFLRDIVIHLHLKHVHHGVRNVICNMNRPHKKPINTTDTNIEIMGKISESKKNVFAVKDFIAFLRRLFPKYNNGYHFYCFMFNVCILQIRF